MVSQAEKAAVIAKWLGWTLGDGYPDPYEDAEAFTRMLEALPGKGYQVAEWIGRVAAIGASVQGALCDAVYEAAKAEKEASDV